MSRVPLARGLQHTCTTVVVAEPVGEEMLRRKLPLESGTDTEIDLIEREMEGGVVVEMPLEVHEHVVEQKLGGLVEVEQDVEVHELRGLRGGRYP